MYETDYSVDDNQIRLGVSVTKVDVERRTVHGFATLDNLDKQGDIVPLEASLKAFERFRGNIREMHQPIAVGRVVSFRPEQMFDKSSGKVHNGVFVSAYISKGAQATWEKVLDGTLSGFSIGGVLTKTRAVYDEAVEKSVRIVDDYDLVELSLVDTPANPYANVTLVQKVDGGIETLVKGTVETIYMCSGDGLVKVSSEDELNCPICHNAMRDVGFVESKDTEKAGIIDTMVAKFMASQNEKEANTMAENETETVEKSEEVVEETPEAVEETVEETVEPVAETEEVEEAPVEEVAKAEDQSDDVNTLLIKSLNAVVETLTSLANRMDGIEKSISDKVANVEDKVSKTADAVDEFGKRVEKVEDTTAFRKSGDLGEVAQEKVEKTDSLWGGSFLKAADL